jgi:hypothetical protein
MRDTKDILNFDIYPNLDRFWKSIFEYRPDSHGTDDYLALCKEIIKRE